MGRLIRGETVTVKRPATTTNRNGDAAPNWASVTETDVDNVAVAPATGTEDASQRVSGVVADLTIYAPTGTDIAGTDRVEVRGTDYEVVGPTRDWRSPYSGDRPGVVVDLKRVAG